MNSFAFWHKAYYVNNVNASNLKKINYVFDSRQTPWSEKKPGSPSLLSTLSTIEELPDCAVINLKSND